MSLPLADGPATSLVGTPEFMAPEVVEGTGHGASADMWSLGVMMCELLTGVTPFADRDSDGQNQQKTYTNIVQARAQALVVLMKCEATWRGFVRKSAKASLR